MAKKNNQSLWREIAVTAGSVAGSAKGLTDTTFTAPHQEQEEPRHEDVSFERSDISRRGAVVTGLSILVGMWLTVGAVFFCFIYLKHRAAITSPPVLPIAEHGQPLPPEPRLQQSPSRDLKQFRQREDWEMTHYHWIDKSKGIVALPIDQAIDLLLQRGIPPATTPPNPTNTPPEDGTRVTGFEGKVEPEAR